MKSFIIELEHLEGILILMLALHQGKNLINENFNTRNITLYFLKSYLILIKQNLYKYIVGCFSKLSFLKRKFINSNKLIYQFFLSTLNNVIFLPRTIIFGSRNCNTFKGSPRKMFEHLENYFYSNGKDTLYIGFQKM